MPRWSLLLLPLFAACAAESSATCADGFALRGDGLCYEEAVTPEDDTGAPDALVAAGGECIPGATDGRIDVTAACVDGVCAGERFDTIDGRFGEASCAALFPGFLECTWPNGIGGAFDDYDEDGVPDEHAFAWGMYVQAPFDGGTRDGIGVGASMSCFFDAFGEPDQAEMAWADGEWSVTAVAFDLLGLYAYDLGGAYGGGPDGKVDYIALYGTY